MKKNVKKCLILMLSLCLFFSIIGCGKKKEKVDVKIWTTDGLEKIMRDDYYEGRNETTLSIELCCNEVEGSQIIITPQNNYQVKNFDVQVSDLKKGNDIISKDKIDVYLEKYINVTNKMSYNTESHTGYWPDALLPFDKAVEYQENKVIGLNQGLYITVTCDENDKSGTYIGNVLLDIDGTKYNVPMSVKVYDFAISKETHVGSLFAVWQQDLIYGELDSSNEMYMAYYEFLADYRCSCSNPVSSFWENYTVDEFVNEIIKRENDPRIATYVLPTRASKTQTMDYPYIKSFIKALIEASKKDAELLNKAVYYFGAFIDEPQYTQTFALAHRIFHEIDQMEEEIITELTSEGYFEKYDVETQNIIKEKIRKIPNLLTTSYTLTATNKENAVYDFGECTYCPLFNEFEGYNTVAGMNNLELYQQLKEVNGSVWWYGCNGPCYPYPCYHIDDSLIGTRILGTMMYNYGIDGNLYWQANAYGQSNNISYGDIIRAANPYEDAARNSPTWPTNGEGFVLYPGVDYGIYGPIGSMRLQAVRDGNEDYEYYYLLNQLSQELSEYYEIEINTNDMVQSLYDKLYSGIKYINDYDTFYDVKKELAATIERCNQDNKVVIKGISYSGEYATINFLVADGYNVYVNDTSLTGVKQGKGYQYTYTIKMDQTSNKFNLYIEGQTNCELAINAGGKTTVLSSFDSVETLNILKGNDDHITIGFNENADYAILNGSAKIEIESKFDPNDTTATLTYAPRISINIKDNNININSLNKLMCNMYNDTNFDITVKFRLNAKGFNYDIKTIVLKPGWNNISIDGICLCGWSSLSSTDNLVFEFYNTKNGQNMEAMPLQVIYIDDLLYSNMES